MKSITLSIVLLITTMLNACGQSEANAPEMVKSAFANKFPNARHVKWGKESKNEWEAEFKVNGMEYSANYDTSGKWLETESEINKKDLPESIKSTLKKDFSEYKTDEAEISETAEGVFYEVKLEHKEKELEVVFDKNAKVIKQKKIDEDEEDND
ncbi:PepSY-like domain-containing protein [Saccharicrinis sp. FJH54]|uniref:PepSY-like domain-containing protein n=1 Tax=Saccharicrinis sp. FJH54 TaxID=3344665 RepID=UPI0035D48737